MLGGPCSDYIHVSSGLEHDSCFIKAIDVLCDNLVVLQYCGKLFEVVFNICWVQSICASLAMRLSPFGGEVKEVGINELTDPPVTNMEGGITIFLLNDHINNLSDEIHVGGKPCADHILIHK